jgi:hypothetical protein
MTDNLIDRLRSAANEIDDTGDIELRKLLADAADKMERLEFKKKAFYDAGGPPFPK